MTENSSTLIEQAHAKMLEEMNNPHSMAEDHIHNWLCNQTDKDLLAGILKAGKSIKNALNTLMSYAKKQRLQVISDDEGFQIIADYFKSDKTEVAQPDGVGTEDNRPKYTPPVVTPKEMAERAEMQRKRNEENQAKQAQDKADKKLANEKKRGVGMISIFDFIDDPVSTQETVELEEEEEGEYENEEDDSAETDD
ncbi:MAG: Cas9 inhibitor AcrIIA9 family protein [Erysipelotrichaceae bacterium]